MSYESPRKARTLVQMTAQVIGSAGATQTYKAGKLCTVQRNPSAPGFFIVWFSKSNICQVRDVDLPETIQYLDGRIKLEQLNPTEARRGRNLRPLFFTP